MSNQQNSKTTYNAREILMYHRYMTYNKIATTLQGSIYYGTNINTSTPIIIKRATRYLVEKKISQNNKIISEDIVKESKILKYLNQNGSNIGIPQIYDFIKDNKNYFLILQYCGESLFNYITKSHTKIINNEININQWKIHIQNIFKQMVNIINLLHTKYNVAHMDISLENFTIFGYEYDYQQNKYIKHGIIYLVDYGLSEYFNKKSFQCSKICGKTFYQSPEMIDKQSNFDASKSDIWALGCALFMMLMNCVPMQIAHKKDCYFKNIINGHLYKMIKDNKKELYISQNALDLLNKIFCYEKKRLSITEILKHKYLQ